MLWLPEDTMVMTNDAKLEKGNGYMQITQILSNKKQIRTFCLR